MGALAPLGSAAIAQGVTTYSYDGSFEDAAFALENAILGKGLVVDSISHVGDMLARTREDVGSDVEIYDNADMYLFCSAVLSRKMMEADPLNLAHCPYGIFVMEREGAVQIGFRDYPEGPMQEVQSFLDEIAQEAVEGF
ncbi:DUF302 domain-containing protein [Pacificitalea manganoxidans]|nr:DUF302 domain-containing protein [Pacificitalea manganoxidans]